jgi:1-acyl-sn-glycerol-3-phosphate acyltransferase
MAKRFFNWWLRFGYWLLLHLTVEGLERVPSHGPVILMINHVNFMDPFVVVASMPRPVTAMSKIENFSIPFWGWVFKLYGAIPVRRGEADRGALKQALEVLKGDTMLLIAPEGTRSPNRALQEAHSGLAYLAYRSQATIVPTALIGTPTFAYHVKRLRRTPVHIRLGQPFRFRDTGHRPDREMLATMTAEAMYQLAALLPPEYRGVYADLDSATETTLEFTDKGRSNLPSPADPKLSNSGKLAEGTASQASSRPSTPGDG